MKNEGVLKNKNIVRDLFIVKRKYGSGDKGSETHSFVKKVQLSEDLYIDKTHTTLDIFHYAVKRVDIA